jgi:hypothetical protein
MHPHDLIALGLVQADSQWEGWRFLRADRSRCFTAWAIAWALVA